MTSPTDIKALVQKINQQLDPITSKFQDRVPLGDITSVLSGNGLDPKAVQNGFQHNDEGRLHVSVGNDVYFTMTWYKFENTGRYEIVAYASSLHDDTKTPAKVMTPAGKAQGRSTDPLNKQLEAIGRKYWKAVGAVAKEGFETRSGKGRIRMHRILTTKHCTTWLVSNRVASTPP